MYDTEISTQKRKSVREKNKMEISTAEAQGKELKGRRYKLITRER